MYIIVKKEQKRRILLSYIWMELECRFSCKNEKYDYFLFFTKIIFSPKIWELLEIL